MLLTFLNVVIYAHVCSRCFQVRQVRGYSGDLFMSYWIMLVGTTL